MPARVFANESFFSACVRTLEWTEVGDVPRGEYWRNAVKGSSEGKGTGRLHEAPVGEKLEQLIERLV